jgi:hypothetical protein
MLTLYWLCFAVGGTFVLLAVLSGLDGVDFGDHDVDVNLDDDVEVTDPRERSPSLFGRQRDPWYSVFSILKSLKFWTFAICFFGLTGLVLSHLSVGLPSGLIAIAATVMGVLCGSLMAGSLRALRRRRVDSLIRTNDLVGLTGTVELPFDQTCRGKVRLLVKGTLTDMIASTDEVKSLQPGDRVLVVGTEQDRIWVVADQDGDGK